MYVIVFHVHDCHASCMFPQDDIYTIQVCLIFQQMHGNFQQMHKAPAQRTVLPAALLSLVCLVPRLRERPRLRLRPAVLFTLKLLVLDLPDDLVPFDLLCLTWGLGEISLPWFNCCATRATDTCSARFLARARAAPGPAGIAVELLLALGRPSSIMRPRAAPVSCGRWLFDAPLDPQHGFSFCICWRSFQLTNSVLQCIPRVINRINKLSIPIFP